MIELNVNNLRKFYGASKIFENISFELQTDERVGLIGQNGCGKTTLMKVLLGDEEYQGGTISFRKGAKVGYLDQIYYGDPDVLVIHLLEESFEDIWQLKSDLKIIEENMKLLKGTDLDREMENYSLLMHEYELAGGYDVDTNINKICQGLMIPDSFRNKPFSMLSGGEKTRVLLARLLLIQPDILLLDEPTNHLDIKSIEWLESFLSEYKGSALIISHDRVFLDKVVNRIIELEPTRANLYNGNYSAYLIQREIRFEQEYKIYVNNQRKIEQMERQIERYRIWGAMRDSDKMYRRAKEIEKRLDKVDVIDRPNMENSKIRLNNSSIRRTGKIVLKVESICKSFENKKLFDNLSFTLFYKDRLCIMGDNGSGKTTLLRIILKEVLADKGKFSLGSNVNIGYLPQIVVFEDEELTILDYFSAHHRISQSEARSELAKMLFVRDDVFKKIKSLSGGEKSRLRLASLILDKINLMILDEPTNHLDIDSREVLEDTLNDYDGTILFVSHDRYFVEKIANKMMIFEDSKVKQYPVSYRDYLDIRKKETLATPEVKTIASKPAPTRPTKKTINSFKLNKTEEEIQLLEEHLAKVNAAMIQNSNNADKLLQLFQEKKELEGNLEKLLNIWAEIQE
jgi:ATPase subunit of ABC transporter with duplicated ATPase domains